MSTPKLQILLPVGISCLVLAALMSSGCARFDGKVDFTADRTSGKAPLSVQFTPVVEGNVHRFVWSFGDEQTSTERSPEHTYVNAGVYTVILTVDSRRREPASVRKEDYVTASAGFGSSPDQLVVQDDDFQLGSPGGPPSFVDPRGDTVYVLGVLENDVPGAGSAALTIIGVSGSGDNYDGFEAITGGGTAMIDHDGTAIEYTPFLGPYDTFYYLVTDGQTTAEGEVSIGYWHDGDHAP